MPILQLVITDRMSLLSPLSSNGRFNTFNLVVSTRVAFTLTSSLSCHIMLYSKPVLRIRIRIRVHMFLGLSDPDPDPLVRGMDPDLEPALDPDPDPSIIMQK